MSDSYMLLAVTIAGAAVPPSAVPAPAAQTQASTSRPMFERRIYADSADCERAAAAVTLPPGLRLVCVPVGAVRLLEAPAY